MGLAPDVEPLPHEALGPRQLQKWRIERSKKMNSSSKENKVRSGKQQGSENRKRVAGAALHLAHLAVAAAAAAIPHCSPSSGMEELATHATRQGDGCVLDLSLVNAGDGAGQVRLRLR